MTIFTLSIIGLVISCIALVGALYMLALSIKDYREFRNDQRKLQWMNDHPRELYETIKRELQKHEHI